MNKTMQAIVDGNKSVKGGQGQGQARMGDERADDAQTRNAGLAPSNSEPGPGTQGLQGLARPPTQNLWLHLPTLTLLESRNMLVMGMAGRGTLIS